jgi:uncharacterized membrane protein YbhN (UPF0104 family)
MEELNFANTITPRILWDGQARYFLFYNESRYRFDMVTISGVPVPEPSAVILLFTCFFAGLGYLRLRRKHNA